MRRYRHELWSLAVLEVWFYLMSAWLLLHALAPEGDHMLGGLIIALAHLGLAIVLTVARVRLRRQRDGQALP